MTTIDLLDLATVNGGWERGDGDRPDLLYKCNEANYWEDQARKKGDAGTRAMARGARQQCQGYSFSRGESALLWRWERD